MHLATQHLRSSSKERLPSKESGKHSNDEFNHHHHNGESQHHTAAADGEASNNGGRFYERLYDMVDEKQDEAKEAFRRWREEEANVERACKTMPFTLCLWIVFVGSQLAHRHVEQSYTQSRSLERLLNVQHPQQVNETTAALGTEDCAAVSGRRLVGGGSGAAGRGNLAEDPLSASSGLAVQSVLSIASPNSVLDWVDETALRVYWMPRNWAGDATTISHFNRVVGGIRLAQARLPQQECKGNADLAAFYNLPCYDAGGSTTSLINGLNQQGFRTNTAAGWSKDKYVYWLDVALEEATVLEATQLLRDEEWLSHPTSLVEAQMVLYNGETTSFIYARVNYQLDRTGYLFPKLTVSTLPAQVYAYTAAIVMDVILLFMVLGLFLDQLVVLFKHWRLGKVRDAIRFNLVLNLAVCGVGFGLAGYFGFLHSQTTQLIDELLAVPPPPDTGLPPDPTGNDGWAERHAKLDIFYDTMHGLVYYQDAADVVVFWYVLLLVVKFFEAFSAVPRLAVISRTLQMATWDLVHFLLVFGLIFLSYSVGAFFLFGQKLLEWSSPGRALNTSFRALMGDFNFQDMYAVAPVSSTIWFWSYMTLIFLVMLNMLLAIIMDTYCEVKEQSKSNADLLTAMQDVMTAYRLRKHQMLDKIEQVIDEAHTLDEASLEAAGMPKRHASQFSRRISVVASAMHAGSPEEQGTPADSCPPSPDGGRHRMARRISRDKVLPFKENGELQESELPPGQPAPPPLSPSFGKENGQSQKGAIVPMPSPKGRKRVNLGLDKPEDSSSTVPSRNGHVAAAWVPIQDFEQRLTRLEQGVREVIASDKKIYVIPEKFSKRAVDIALAGDSIKKKH